MVNGLTLPQNAMQHDDCCVVNFCGANIKMALTAVRSRVRESHAKRLI